MGAIYVRLHQYEKAETSYKTALAYNSNYKPALSGLSVLYSWSGQNDSAKVYITQAIRSGDSSIASSLCLAIIDLKRGDSAGAASVNDQINKIDTLDNTSLIFLAGINKGLKNEKKLASILSTLDHRNVKDSLLDLCISNKISETDFFNQKGQSISYGK
jgi:Tfp pilus assembly protein PilF